MSNIAIQVEGLSKQYRLGPRERYRTLRDTLSDTLSAPFRRFRSRDSSNPHPEKFWALKDVSFEVKHGEVIGIIGRNGAGKSTLLKILSRITEPTEGKAHIHGRIASLLEVGTGFHPELTGRDNIFLNGAILGMKKAEIRRKFDEIVAFAEVDKFIDTPVKHYSSGMYVRLAFAVAAHLEPEILVVDEVLAVGDHQFQTKCINKMSEVGRAGRTIFFVSHSMSAVQRLCNRVIVLSNGRLCEDTDPAHAIAEYMGGDATASFTAPASTKNPSITGGAVFLREGVMHISVQFHSPFALSPPVFGFAIYDPLGNPIFGTNSRRQRVSAEFSSMKSGCIEAIIPVDTFRPNQYFISLWLADHYVDYCALEKALQIQVDCANQQDDLPAQVVGSFCLPTSWRYRTESAHLPAENVTVAGD